MKRTILVFGVLAAAAALLGAQQASQPGSYEGTSSPPPDDTITPPAPETAPVAKPSPSHPMAVQPDAQPQPGGEPQAQTAHHSLDGSLYTIPANSGPANQGPANAGPADHGLANNISANGADGTDDGIVQVAPDTSAAPALNQRPAANDPDGDIVHPGPLPPGTLGEGAVI